MAWCENQQPEPVKRVQYNANVFLENIFAQPRISCPEVVGAGAVF